MHRFFHVILATLLVCLLGACSIRIGATTPSPVVIWFSGDPALLTRLRPTLQSIAKDQPTVPYTISTTALTQDELEASLAKAKQGQGTKPDIIIDAALATPHLAQAGYLAPVTGFDISDTLPAAVAMTQWQQQSYALPLTLDYPVLYLNPDLLQRTVKTATPPATMTDLVQLATSVKENDASLSGIALAPTAGATLPFLYAFGGSEVQSDGRTIAINQPQAVAGVDQVFYLASQSALRPPDATDGAIADFTAGKVAMLIAPASRYPEMQGQGVFTGNTTPLVAAIPAGNVTAYQRAPLNGLNISLTAFAAHATSARSLMTQLTTFANQFNLATSLKALPARQNALIAVKAQLPASQYAATARPMLVNPSAIQFYIAYDQAISNGIAQHQGAQPTLNTLAQAWQGKL